ncbi:hypothetical protein ACVR2I_004151 [Cronobacter sakazakii]
MKKLITFVPLILTLALVNIMAYGKSHSGCYSKRFNKTKGVYAYSEYNDAAENCLYEETDSQNMILL